MFDLAGLHRTGGRMNRNLTRSATAFAPRGSDPDKTEVGGEHRGRIKLQMEKVAFRSNIKRFYVVDI